MTPWDSEGSLSNDSVGAIVGWSFGCHSFQTIEGNGGDDGTRTRGLCRDSEIFTRN